MDESSAELQRENEAIARDEPELQDLRGQLQDLNEQHRERREILEAGKAERLQLLYDEIRYLEESER